MSWPDAFAIAAPILAVGIAGAIRIHCDHKEALLRLIQEHKETMRRIEMSVLQATEGVEK